MPFRRARQQARGTEVEFYGVNAPFVLDLRCFHCRLINALNLEFGKTAVPAIDLDNAAQRLCRSRLLAYRGKEKTSAAFAAA
jgi:hypothetical protein